MIGIGSSISHTGPSIQYGWNQDKDAKVVYKKNLVGSNPKEITEEFKLIQSMNSNCERNTFSFVLSPTIEDGKKMTSNDFKLVVSEFLKEMKLDDHQGIAFIHQDKEHRHVHLYVNRIGFDGKAYEDNYVGKKSQRMAEKVAIKLNLKTVKQYQKEKLESLKDLRSYVHSRHKIVSNSFNPEDISGYVNQMRQFGIKAKPVINKSKSLQGFRYSFKNLNLKGSEVHRSMSINKMRADYKNLNNSLNNNL